MGRLLTWVWVPGNQNCLLLLSSLTPICYSGLFSFVSFFSYFSFPVQLSSFTHKTSSSSYPPSLELLCKLCKFYLCFFIMPICYSPISFCWDQLISTKPVEMDITVAPVWKLQRLLFQVVVIFDGHVPSTNLSETLKYLVKNRTYLEWKSVNAEEQETFWARLRETILAASSRCPPITNDK